MTFGLLAGLATLVLLGPLGVSAAPAAAAATTPPPAVHEVYAVPPGGAYTIAGHGAGHGHGLSQWGAYGAAKVDHLSSNQILAFYYPHTTLATKSTSQPVRVLLSAADAPAKGYLEFDPAPGLAVALAGNAATTLGTASPDGEPVDLWRIAKSGASLTLQAHYGGTWHDQTPTLGATATVTDTASLIGVEVPSGSSTKSVDYRGAMVAQLQSGALQVVDDVPVDAYVDSVVPAEMPSSWSPAALQAQAVAARTYAWRAMAAPKASWYDLDGDTRDQSYPGAGVETTRTDNAVHATAGEIVVDASGAAVFAQYSSSDGGWTVSGGEPYLPAERDPYDAAVPNGENAWSTTVTAAAIAAAYPSVGALRQLVVTGRDGHGVWGGRVTTLSVVGANATVTTTGAQFAAALGLHSPWFRPTPPPGAPTAVAASASGGTVTVTWTAPAVDAGAAAVTGYRVRLTPGAHRTTVTATATTATFTGITAGTYTATVVATSAAGASPAGSASVTVVLV